MRRGASTSRTFGRFAVGPAGRSWTLTPVPARYKQAKNRKKNITYPNAGLTGPTPSGMTRLFWRWVW